MNRRVLLCSIIMSALLGCEVVPVGGQDAGTTPGATDAGIGATDGGAGTTDAGLATDAGATDAGAAPDAGTSTTDAGTGETDAGTGVTDGGGMVTTDAGTGATDAGAGGTDAGTRSTAALVGGGRVGGGSMSADVTIGAPFTQRPATGGSTVLVPSNPVVR